MAFGAILQDRALTLEDRTAVALMFLPTAQLKVGMGHVVVAECCWAGHEADWWWATDVGDVGGVFVSRSASWRASQEWAHKPIVPSSCRASALHREVR